MVAETLEFDFSSCRCRTRLVLLASNSSTRARKQFAEEI